MAQARHRTGLRRAAAAFAAVVALACAGKSVPRDALVEQYPKLASFEGQRLADANPYVLPLAGRVTFFHCHWPTDEPIPIALPTDASAEERKSIELAMRAWEDAGLGIRFLEVDAATASVDIGFVGGTVDTAAGQDTANTVVDCRVASTSPASDGNVAGARLVAARIRIARMTNPNTQGHQRKLSPAELTGTALHELGHALGFQGHAKHGETIMVRETEKIARAGKDLRAGNAFSDASLGALYALPNGAVVTTVEVDRCRTDLVDRMARLAEENQLEGPFVRVGEAAARVFWRDEKRVEFGLVIAKLRETLNDPTQLLVIPEANARQSLSRTRDLPCKR